MDDEQGRKISVSVPIGAIAAVAVLALALAAAYFNASSEVEGSSSGFAGQGGKKLGRKIGLRALITLLENDATRRVLIATLKAMARRS